MRHDNRARAVVPAAITAVCAVALMATQGWDNDVLYGLLSAIMGAGFGVLAVQLWAALWPGLRKVPAVNKDPRGVSER